MGWGSKFVGARDRSRAFNIWRRRTLPSVGVARVGGLARKIVRGRDLVIFGYLNLGWFGDRYLPGACQGKGSEIWVSGVEFGPGVFARIVGGRDATLL